MWISKRTPGEPDGNANSANEHHENVNDCDRVEFPRKKHFLYTDLVADEAKHDSEDNEPVRFVGVRLLLGGR